MYCIRHVRKTKIWNDQKKDSNFYEKKWIPNLC